MNQIIRIIPIVILFIGVVFLLKGRKFNNIFIGIIILFLMETFSYFGFGIKEGKVSWLLYFSGPLYLILINSIYNDLFFKVVKKLFFKVIISVIVILLGLFLIYPINANFVFHYNAFIGLIILGYPISYFLKLIKQEIQYNLKYFSFNAIVFLFFSLDIILYVMLKFIVDVKLFESIKGIAYFRFFIIQLFYISLIYFGYQLSKAKNE